MVEERSDDTTGCPTKDVPHPGGMAAGEAARRPRGWTPQENGGGAEVKPGYKQTEVGVIPEEWDAEKLGNLVALQRGHDLTWRDRRRGDVPVMGSAGQNGFHDTALAKGPGVLLGRSGASFGQAHYCEQDFWPHNTALYVTDFRGNDPLFVFYFLKSIDFTRHNSGGAQQSLNRNFIYPIPVGVPRPTEQRAIAEALSDVDALLGGLDQLIAKKRDLKQAAMQQLLTGQTRLPGFHGEWAVKPLASVCSMKSGQSITSANIDDFSQYPCYGGNGLRGFTSRFTHVGSYALIGRQGALCGNVLGVEGTFFASEHAVVVTAFAQTDIRWLTCVLAEMRLNRYSEASAQPGLSVAKVLNMDVQIPPTKAEQTAIAEVLSDLDAELEALEQRRAKTRALKQGMMQELLTGRTRLV